MNSATLPDIYLPPVNRSMQVLDRTFFRKTIPTSAAAVADPRKIQSVRTALLKSREILPVPGFKVIRSDITTSGGKCILLDPEVKISEPATWSPTLSDLVSSSTISLKPYDVQLTYDDWTMANILEAVLPDLIEDDKETPTGFAQAGHVAHLNLRKPYLPFKHIIAEVLLDKNVGVRTVINKTLDVGAESVFRTFPYEVLAGPDDLDVTVHESGCVFEFNFGKVYWNSRLGTEHERLIAKFREGEAVCDVMAGVGPFAIPAGKKRVWTWANDLNPESYTALEKAIEMNKVSTFVRPFCADGREFIKSATTALCQGQGSNSFQKLPNIKSSRNASVQEKKDLQRRIQAETITLYEPIAFDHYVMNLPASAVEFLDAFKGTYAGREHEFEPNTVQKLPMIHVYTFQATMESQELEHQQVLEKASHYLGAKVSLDQAHQDIEIYDVRLVAPKKRMYCVSFRLPSEVAFSQS